MPRPYQAGTALERTEWIQETNTGQIPSNPSWNLFSDAMGSVWDWEPDANTQRQNATGSLEAQGHFNGAETHEGSFTYDLQQWYVDGSNNTVDPGGDFLRFSSGNTARNTHAVVTRSEHPDNGGTADSGIRRYTVGKGGYPSSITIPFETEDGSPVEQELTYQFEKVRQYAISQPSSSTTLDISSSDTGDTSQTLTIEDEGANTTEDVSLNGTSTVTTSGNFDNIDAAELDSETAGDVTISDGSNDLLVIQGQNSYPSGEGDLGVPALGSGSHASAIGSSYIRFLDDTLTLPNLTGSTNDEYEITSGEATVDISLGDDATTGSARRSIYIEDYTYTVTASLAGERMSVEQTINYLTEQTGTITWDAGSNTGSIDFNTSFIQSPGTYTKESGNGKIVFDNEFAATDITVSN